MKVVIERGINGLRGEVVRRRKDLVGVGKSRI